MDADAACREAGALLRRASAVVVLTGAGVSTESGIPDFRSPGGLWTRYDPRELTYDRFCTDPGTRIKYWRLATESYPVLRQAQPNATHEVVARIETAGKLLKLVTQNIDGLHHKAGSSQERTIEIHGSSLRARCIACGCECDRADIHEQITEGRIEVPACPRCTQPVKPATISFGQAMPEPETGDAFEAARTCDLMLACGSSLVVYPAAGLPDEAVRAGAPLVIVNNEATDKDSLAAVVVRGAAGESMSLIARHAGI